MIEFRITNKAGDKIILSEDELRNLYSDIQNLLCPLYIHGENIYTDTVGEYDIDAELIKYFNILL